MPRISSGLPGRAPWKDDSRCSERVSHRFFPPLIAALLSLSVMVDPSGAGVGQWSPRGPFGGVVLQLAIDPADSTGMLAYSVGDGLLRLAEDGESWAPIELDASPVCSLVASPGTFYLSTWDSDAARGTFWRSTDGGLSWTAMAPPPAESLPTCAVRVLAADPRDADILYAVSEKVGAFRSTDGGASWTLMSTDLEANLEIDLLVPDPSDSERLFLGGVFNHPGPQKLVLLFSEDGGETWTDVSAGLPSEPEYGMSMAIEASTPPTVYLVLPDDGVFRSTDSGASWQILPEAPAVAFNQTFLALDPNAPSTLYLATDFEGLFRSTDRGNTWTRHRAGIPTIASIQGLATDPLTPSRLFIATHFGVYRSVDGAETWSQMNDGMGARQVLGVAIDPRDSDRVYASTSSLGVFRSRDRGAHWEWPFTFVINNRHIVSVEVDPEDSSILHAFGTARFDGIFRSTDGGDSFEQTFQHARFSETRSLVLDPVDSRFVYAIHPGGFLRSNDRGASWTELDTGIEGFLSVLAIDPTTRALYVVDDSHRIYRSRSRGNRWSLVSEDLTTDITSLAVDPEDPDVLYAGTAGDGLLRSTNRGASWRATSFPTGGVVRELIFDPRNPSTFYVSTYDAVYRSNDSGERFKPLDPSSLDTPRINDLALDPSYPHRLWAATESGLFEIEVIEDRTELLLHGGRFEVEVEWTDFEAATGPGSVAFVSGESAGAIDLKSRDSAVVELFDPQNWEFLIKVLDGTAITGHFWVFLAAATDVGYRTTVTDTRCGDVKTYVNPLGMAARAVTDTAAFPGCPSPLPPGCVEDEGVLCLGEGGRFQVEVEWSDFMGQTGFGRQVRLAQPGLAQSDDSGLFYFFGVENWELLIKVLDGCAINGRFWVFGAATTDVGYTLRITDTVAGAERVYVNPLGASAAAITDSGAFATCF